MRNISVTKLIQFACLAAVLTLPNAAAAQQQTVESAQRFLSQVLVGQHYRSSLSNGGANPRPGLITAVQTVGRCDTRITHQYAAGYWNNLEFSAETHTWSDRNLAYLSEVRQHGSVVGISWTIHTNRSTFELSSETLAIRVAAALEFLRQNCDVTSDTGF